MNNKIYLASNYSTWPSMQENAKLLENLGFEITSEWIKGTHSGNTTDYNAEYAKIDLSNLDDADTVIFWSEAPLNSRTRGGKHVELGYAIAKNKRIFIVGPPLNIFHFIPGIINRMYFEDILSILNQSNE